MIGAEAASLRARLGIRVNVTCHEPGVLPRYEGKAERVQVRAPE
jgi:phenylacetate-coenzyme A ligase PaaK-like adenylate-forming protein